VVNAAMFTLDYSDTKVDPILKADAFAWTPPAGAQEFHQPAAQPADADRLVGKPAPAFSVAGLDGKNVTNDQLKGSVYVLDFWATWCGPCVASLPGLDKIYQDNKAAGLKVFAVNQGEDKDTVQKFVNDTKLTIPPLLDADQSVGAAYGANAIPETVLVGKDGVIRKVFIGGGHEDDIRAAVEAELKGQ
jgi:peroxiredoxin